ncbi:uncharacterized protein DDB_G0281497 isoform X1 [Tetranychus urticae]|uniref:uncharacterized protein DDB_G0281497 isoform X1 n=2 Tax=Tetranychus urticae TaxID=32264 RepID=UPI00077BAB69|nr:uncharacterized protein DDB_G0281497 isoform X1 [Tetranychus urticae]
MFCWLLKEAKMPAVDENNIGALALHYAAAKGCPICVKLLVESCPELRNACGCIDSLDYWNTHLPGHHHGPTGDNFYLRPCENGVNGCGNVINDGVKPTDNLHFPRKHSTSTTNSTTGASPHHHHHHLHHHHLPTHQNSQSIHRLNSSGANSSKASDSGKESVADEDSLLPPSTSNTEPFFLHDPSCVTSNDRVKKLFRKNRPKGPSKVYEKHRKSDNHPIKLVKAEVYTNSDEGTMSESSDPPPDYDHDHIKCDSSSSPPTSELTSSMSSGVTESSSSSSSTNSDKCIYQEFDDLEKRIYQEVDELEPIIDSSASTLSKKTESEAINGTSNHNGTVKNRINSESKCSEIYIKDKIYSIDSRPLKVAPNDRHKEVKNLIAKLDVGESVANGNTLNRASSMSTINQLATSSSSSTGPTINTSTIPTVNQQTQTTSSIQSHQLPPPPPPPPPANLLISKEAVSKIPLSSSSSSSSEYEEPGSNNVDKSRKLKLIAEKQLAFIPPQFNSPPDSDTNIKPSEYLKRVAGKTVSASPRFINSGSGPGMGSGGGCKEMIFFEKRRIKRSSSETHLYQPHMNSSCSSSNEYEAIKDDSHSSASSVSTHNLHHPHTLHHSHHHPLRPSSSATSEHLYETCHSTKSGWSSSIRSESSCSSNSHSTLNGLGVGSGGIGIAKSNLINRNGLSGSTCNLGNGYGVTSGSIDGIKGTSFNESSQSNNKSIVELASSTNQSSSSSSPANVNGSCNFTVTQDELKRIHLRKTVKPSNERTVLLHKNDVIAELKMSRDLDGIKKRKEQDKSRDEVKDKMAELANEYTAEKFLDKVATHDNSGVPIPQWKRLMLAKKSAEKARKEAEQEFLSEHEAKRISAIPEWKRQLLNRKDEPGYGYSSNSSTTSSSPTESYRFKNENQCSQSNQVSSQSSCKLISTNQSHHRESNPPWSFKLRKTNSIYW